MPASGRNVILVPAFNEEANIARTIGLIRKTGIRSRIVVVNDGSTDRTGEIAKSLGCKVIGLPKNFGKANAFLAGIRFTLRDKDFGKNLVAITTLDADMTAIPKEALQKMIGIAAKAGQEKKIKQVISNFAEGMENEGAHYNSGLRSFSVQAAWKLAQSRVKGVPHGLGLEVFQNEFFKGKTEVLDKTGFRQEKPYRLGAGRQLLEHKITHSRMKRKMGRMRPGR